MDPLPQTCEYCGICSEHYCTSADEALRCTHKKRAIELAKRQNEYKREVETERSMVNQLSRDIETPEEQLQIGVAVCSPRRCL